MRSNLSSNPIEGNAPSIEIFDRSMGCFDGKPGSVDSG